MHEEGPNSRESGMDPLQDEFGSSNQKILGQSEDQRIIKNRLTEVLSRDSNIKD
jgi:hypothetical protein